MDGVEVNPADHRCTIEDDIVVFAVRARVPTHDEIVRAGLAEQQGHDLPTLVLARISMVVTFRKERSGPGGHPGRTADRRIVAHLSL